MLHRIRRDQEAAEGAKRRGRGEAAWIRLVDPLAGRGAALYI
jgi:hypothetical protein